MMNGEETDGGISLGDMEKALVCLLMTSMEAPVQAESAGLTQEMFADASLGFVYEVIMKIYATGVRPDMVLVERGMREADEELAAKLGGLSFLLPYMLNVRHDGNVAAYVEGIKKQYKLRCLVTLFGTMAFKAGKVSRPGGRGLPAPFGWRPPEGGDTGTDGGTECKGVEATGVGQQLSGADGFADESCLRGACRQGVPAGDERPARFGDDRAGGGLRGVHLPSRTLWLHPRRKDGA